MQATVVALLVCVSGCADAVEDSRPTAAASAPGTTPIGTSAAPPAVALDATVKQYRADEARRTLQITVTNRERRPVVVEHVQLVSPAFEAVPSTPADATLRPDELVDIRSGYGAVRCPANGASGAAGTTGATGAAGATGTSVPSGPAAVAVRVRPQTGPALQVTLPLAQPNPLLDKLRDRECRQERLAAALSVQLRPEWARGTSGGEPVLAAALELGPRAQDVRLHGVSGSVFYDLRVPSAPGGAPAEPRRVGPAGAVTTVPIEIRRNRCDAHALAELDRRHFVFRVRVSRADDAPEDLTFTTDEPTQRRLRDELPYLCGS